MQHIAYMQEGKQFALDELGNLLNLDKLSRETAEDLITKMLKRGAIIPRNPNTDETIESVEYKEYYIKWVGVIVYKNITIICYPKYLSTRPSNEKMSRILLSIRKAQNKRSFVSSPVNEKTLNGMEVLSSITELFALYEEYGEYTNYETTWEHNGNGIISWERTIGNCQPFFDDSAPIYYDLITKKTNRIESDYITRLHKALLTYYSHYLHEVGLDILLDIPLVELSEEQLDDFGGADAIMYYLERELGVQFVTWKRALLMLIEVLIAERDADYEWAEIQCIGTSSYMYVWEIICQSVFGDQLDRSINSLGIKLSAEWEEKGKEKLASIIPYPKIYIPIGTSGEEQEYLFQKTLEPDLVTVIKYDDKQIFCIYDAKYYVPSVGKNVIGAPGLESLTKQLLYQEAYKEFIKDQQFDHVLNIFLMPTEAEGNPEYFGRMSFLEIFPFKPEPFTNDIGMWKLDADKMGKLYLSGSTIEIETVRHIIDAEIKRDEELRNEE